MRSMLGDIRRSLQNPRKHLIFTDREKYSCSFIVQNWDTPGPADMSHFKRSQSLGEWAQIIETERRRTVWEIVPGRRVSENRRHLRFRWEWSPGSYGRMHYPSEHRGRRAKL